MNSPYNGKFKVSQLFKGAVHDGLDLVGIDSKEVHSTVNGVVEKAGWENVLNRKQGFGLYVRIKKTDSQYFFVAEMRIINEDMEYSAMRESCKYNRIRNNYITRAGYVNWGAPGIQAYYVSNLDI